MCLCAPSSTSPHPPLPCRADVGRLDTVLLSLAKGLAPSAEEVAHQQEALEAVTAALQAEWPKAKVHLFGKGMQRLRHAATPTTGHHGIMTTVIIIIITVIIIIIIMTTIIIIMES